MSRTVRQKRVLRAALGIGLVIILGFAAAIAPGYLEDPGTRKSDRDVAGVTDDLRRDAPSRDYGFRFVDRTDDSGIDFVHAGGGGRSSLLPEDMGSGAAWGDYDGDGDPDLYLVDQPASWLESDPSTGPDALPRNALYRNDGDGRFTDVSSTSGADDGGFGMGALFADLDGDGDLDLLVTNIGPDVLLENRGDGTFRDVTGAAGISGGAGFSAGAAAADYDLDGDLDLYVTRYVEFGFDPEDRERTGEQYGQGIPFTLNPSSYPPAANSLFRNDGGLRFTDVAAELGVSDTTGRGMGVAFVDLDDDGDPEIYVANDISTNALFENLGDGTFGDVSGPSLAADYRGAMGLAVADHDQDRDLDIFITHWIAQENSLYESLLRQVDPPRLVFTDAAELLGLGHVALRRVGWGTEFADLDLDGRLDLVVVNGSTFEDEASPPHLLAQPGAIYWNGGIDQGYFDIVAQVAPDLATPSVGRGLACADYDGDGDTDLLVTRNRGRALLLENQTGDSANSLSIRFSPPLPGIRVEVTRGDSSELRVTSAGLSYLSGHEIHPVFGLGEAGAVDRLSVRFPDGWTRTWEQVPAGRILVERGEEMWHALSP